MFHGSIVALVTPMGEEGEIDYDSLARLLEFHIDQGTDAIVAVGTTGESATLSAREHCEVIRFVVETVRGRLPVIAGTGSNSTAEAIELSTCAMEAGADACLLVTPYYNKPTQEGLVQHYRAIAAAVPLPHIVYNVPGRTACDMLPETVARLADVGNIIGIKEATGDIGRVERILSLCGDKLHVYSGDDATALQAIQAGAKGDISVTANVAPRAMQQMCAAALAGDMSAAAGMNERLMPLHTALFVEANPIPVKWALHQMGMIGPGIRLPLTPLAAPHHGTVREALRAAGVLS